MGAGECQDNGAQRGGFSGLGTAADHGVPLLAGELQHIRVLLLQEWAVNPANGCA